MRFRAMVFPVLAIGLLGLTGLNGAAADSHSGAEGRSPGKQRSQVREKGDYKVTFVELGSVNCIPCKMMQPVMAEIEKEFGDQVNVVFYDVWTKEGRRYGEAYKIQAIPTQVFLDKNGKEYFRHLGFFSKDEIVKVLRRQGVK